MNQAEGGRVASYIAYYYNEHASIHASIPTTSHGLMHAWTLPLTLRHAPDPPFCGVIGSPRVNELVGQLFVTLSLSRRHYLSLTVPGYVHFLLCVREHTHKVRLLPSKRSR